MTLVVRILLQIVFALLIWMLCVLAGHILTETQLRLAKIKAFDFPPLNCRKCLTFWLTVSVSIITMFVLNLTISSIIIAVLAILTAIAMHLQDKKWIEK